MVKINSNAVMTAYIDLKSIQRLILNLNENKEFACTHIYSIFRDTCLIIHEIIDKILDNVIEVDERIKKIRNTVHLYIKKGGGQNQKVYKKIVDYHINAFGEDTNNIGFYLNESNEVIGSTLYCAYIFLRTENLPFPNSETKDEIRDKTFSFAQYIGEVSAILLNMLEELFEIKTSDELMTFEKVDSKESYRCKDVNHKLLFSFKSDLSNSFILRLIFSLQEINDVIWLKEKYIDKLQKPINLDWYILLRLVSLKTDEIMDNFFNIKQHLENDFQEWNIKSNGNVEYLIDKYEQGIKEECSTLRNMIHYNIETESIEDNFLGFYNKKVSQDLEYPLKFVNEVINLYFKPLRSEILKYLNIDKITPLSDWEIIKNRLFKQ
ncbi:hypothetical protein AZI98_06090 [Aeribacillus pallidus]|uniref:Uncharacterized protein n=1 Tax=Aeribacillus pallidus TaxID=33936 RepID=A0A165YIU0_9BACI|nr:hypothetical protein [Aeribacillus pallidus]KZN97126.1 hypothetical protein AZI98_06090 [Aeribacillus pallidus]